MFHYFQCFIAKTVSSRLNPTKGFHYLPQELKFAAKMLRKALKKNPNAVFEHFIRVGNGIDLLSETIEVLSWIAKSAREKGEVVIAFDLFSLLSVMLPREKRFEAFKTDFKKKQKEISEELWSSANRSKNPDPKA